MPGHNYADYEKFLDAIRGGLFDAWTHSPGGNDSTSLSMASVLRATHDYLIDAHHLKDPKHSTNIQYTALQQAVELAAPHLSKEAAQTLVHDLDRLTSIVSPSDGASNVPKMLEMLRAMKKLDDPDYQKALDAGAVLTESTISTILLGAHQRSILAPNTYSSVDADNSLKAGYYKYASDHTSPEDKAIEETTIWQDIASTGQWAWEGIAAFCTETVPNFLKVTGEGALSLLNSGGELVASIPAGIVDVYHTMVGTDQEIESESTDNHKQAPAKISAPIAQLSLSSSQLCTGCTGEDVLKIQTALLLLKEKEKDSGIDLGTSGVRGNGADGTYGAKTSASVQHLQMLCKLDLADGIVGEKTLAMLNGMLKKHNITQEALDTSVAAIHDAEKSTKDVANSLTQVEYRDMDSFHQSAGLFSSVRPRHRA